MHSTHTLYLHVSACIWVHHITHVLGLTSAGVGRDIAGFGSITGAGLQMAGPWNHPLMDSLVLLGDRTSDTCANVHIYIMWLMYMYCSIGFIGWPGGKTLQLLQRTQSCSKLGKWTLRFGLADQNLQQNLSQVIASPYTLLRQPSWRTFLLHITWANVSFLIGYVLAYLKVR